MRLVVSAGFVVAVGLALSGCDTSDRSVASETASSPYDTPGRNLALISARTGTARLLPWRHLSSAVADGRGGWLVGNFFAGVARLRSDGSVDPTWRIRQALAFGTCEIVRVGSRLYAESYDGVEAFDLTTKRRLWTSPRATPRRVRCHHGVLALAASSTRVYIGGDFAKVGGVSRRGLAALDARTGRLLEWQIPSRGSSLDGAQVSVHALELAGSRLYVGGNFTSVGGQERSGFAALDADSGALLPWKRAFGGGSGEILATHRQVITAGPESSWHFDAASARTGHRLAWTSRLRGTATEFAVDGPILYLGGGPREGFGTVAGRPRRNLAAFNLTTGRFTSWAPRLAADVTVNAIIPSGDQVLVIGWFTNTVG